MLAVAVHEQDSAAPCMIKAGHQRGFLAEIARQRNHLDIERIGIKPARYGERVIGTAVIDIHDLAA